MGAWPTWAWGLLALGGAFGLYGLHRLALRLEDQGHLYYLRKSPKGGGGMGAFVAVQRAIEPAAQHVLEVQDVRHVDGGERAPGPDDGPSAPPRGQWEPHS